MAFSIKYRFLRLYKGWFLISILLTALILVPLVIVLSGIFVDNEKTSVILDLSFGTEEILNTFKLCAFTLLLTFIAGTGTAWLVSQYRFPLRNFFEWALLLPLTIPGYILAFTYAGIFSFTGSYHSILEMLGITDQRSWHFDVMTFPFLVLIISLSLFPYVFITAKNAFTGRYSATIESARSLGTSSSGIFFKIALPLARPAIAAGLFLVGMETLNEYGASSYFGIRTLTTAIFRSWQYDLGAALWIASLLFFTVLLFIVIEKLLRGRSRYAENSRSVNSVGKKLKGWKSLIAFTICALIFLFAFLIPFFQILYWAFLTFEKVVTREFIIMAYNSFVLAFLAAMTVVIVSLLISYSQRINRLKILSTFSTIGYAVPGAVIAVGILVICGFGDKFISQTITHQKGLFFTGSIFMIVFAYVVRFLAVSYQPIQSAFEKQSSILSNTSRSLGKNTLFTLLKIDLPIIKSSIIIAIILVFVDVLKELPLTMILRPFDFETLATETYRHAKVMESVPESANSALLIILTGMIPLYLLHRLMKKKNAV